MQVFSNLSSKINLRVFRSGVGLKLAAKDGACLLS